MQFFSDENTEERLKGSFAQNPFSETDMKMGNLLSNREMIS